MKGKNTMWVGLLVALVVTAVTATMVSAAGQADLADALKAA